MSYKPLPDCVTIDKSPIHGLGLFATEDIPKGTNLGRSHFVLWGRMERTPLGAFYNHSEEPNIKRKLAGNDKWIITTIRDIKVGEELTAVYSMYNIDDDE